MMQASEKPTPVLYLDLDGTVRQGKDDALGRFVNGPEDVVVFPEAVEMMRRWKAAGGRIVGVTNQGGVALGIVSYERMVAAVLETHRQADSLFDHIHICVHHPDADSPEMARCWCRKPSAGAVVEAIHGLREKVDGEFWPPYMGLFVGDRPEDFRCASDAGLDFEWAHDWRARANGHAETPPEPDDDGSDCSPSGEGTEPNIAGPPRRCASCSAPLDALGNCTGVCGPPWDWEDER